MKRALRSRKIQSAAVLLLALGLLWLFFRGSNLDEIRDSLLRASPRLIFWSLVATMGTYLLRAVRWQVLLSPLGSPRLSNCFSTTVIGFMVNFLVPLRVGEVVRPYLLARREGFSASGAFATIVLERVFDLATVVFLIGFWLVVAPDRSRSAELVAALEVAGLTGLALAVVLLSAMFLFARYPDRSMELVRRLFGFLPRGLAVRALGFFETFRAGLGVLVKWSSFVKATSLSLVLWLNVCFSFWLIALAFDIHPRFGDTFLVIGFLTVGVSVPTPGAIGGYHYMCALALTTLFGTEASLAKAVALAAHAISFLPVTLLGILLFAKAGLSFRQVQNITASREEVEGPPGGEENEEGDGGEPVGHAAGERDDYRVDRHEGRDDQ